MMDLALREEQIITKRRDLVFAAGGDPTDVCCSCGSDMVTTKRIFARRMSFRRRYCPMCDVGEHGRGAEVVDYIVERP